MKKVYLLLILFTFGLINIVNALDLELSEQIISFPRPDKFGLQGFTTINNHLFVVLIEDGDTSSIIKVFDLNNSELINEYSFRSLGHANDVTYNKDNNKIYVLRGGGSSLVDVFNGDTFRYENTLDSGLPIRSITYVDSKDEFYVRTVATGFRLNSELKLASKMPFVMGMNFTSDIGRQGWEYYNNFIYYTNWSWIRFGGDGSNIIYIYDLDGNLRDSLHTDYDIGEIEDIAFYNNKMILGFNGYDNNIKFYVSNIPSVPELVIDNDTESDKENEEINKDNKYNILLIIGSVFTLGVIFVVIKKCVIK